MLRFLQLLALIVWLGGIIFFGAVLAPTVFHVLPERQLAGALVNASLTKLHFIGLGCGVVFLLASLFSGSRSDQRRGRPYLQQLAIATMLALTCISQFRIMPRMDRLRHDMGVIELTSMADPLRIAFDRLHHRSTQVEGAVLVLGLMVVWALARTERD